MGYSSEDDTFLPSLLTVQPLFQTQEKLDTIFFQGRLHTTYYDDTFSRTEVTTNLGLGYRRLLANKTLMLGVNSFYDRNWYWEHERVSYGAEVKFANFDLYLNYYDAISNQITKQDLTQKALSGYDIELITALPYLPWFQVGYKAYRWESNFYPEDIKGSKISLLISPTDNLTIEASSSKGESRDIEVIDENKILARYRFFLDRESNRNKIHLRDLVDDKAFRLRDMTSHLTDIVRREDRIITEQKSSSSGLVKVVRVD